MNTGLKKTKLNYLLTIALLLAITGLANCSKTKKETPYWMLLFVNSSSGTAGVTSVATTTVSIVLKDASGAVIPNATLTITSKTSSVQERLAVSTTATSDSNGVILLNMSIGNYNCTITKQDGTVLGKATLTVQTSTSSATATAVVTITEGGGNFSVTVVGATPISTTSYAVGGTISGLTASGLTLQNNGKDNLVISSGSNSFLFQTAIENSAAYSVAVSIQPTGLTCTVTNGNGTVQSSHVTNVSLACAGTSTASSTGTSTSTSTATNTYTIGGTISGLTASGLVLQNNTSDDLTVTGSAITFTFATSLASGATYSVTMKTQPTDQNCTVTNGSGTASANVSNVTISCVNKSLYAAGYSKNSSIVQVPGYWKDGTWIALTPIDATKHSQVNSIVISGSDIYTAGYSNNSSNVSVPGYWKNGSWTALTPIDATKSSIVYSIVVSGSDIYAAGYSTNSSNASVPGYWKNGTWTALTPIDATKSSIVYSIVVSGSDIYAAGASGNSSTVYVPGYWKNGNWTALTPIDATKTSAVSSMVVSGLDIYAAGYSLNSSTIQVPGYWKNGNWTALTPIDSTKHSQVNSIVISGSDIYTAGYSNNSSSVNVPGYWKNGTWTGLTPIDATKNSLVNSILGSGSDIYAAGYSINSSSVQVAGYWKNGTWTALTPIDATKGSQVNSIIFQ